MKERSEKEYTELDETLESYSIEELEKYAIELNVRRNDEEALNLALLVRRCKIVAEFEWTPENKARLLCLDRKLIECFEQLKAEATVIFEQLTKRVEAKDDFLQDFEINAQVTPFFYVLDENGELRYEAEEGIERVLMDNFHREGEYVPLNFSGYNAECLDNIMYLDREDNRNTDTWLKGAFDDEYISFAIHDLYDHTSDLSLQDILRFNHLRMEITVKYQHDMDI
ncbi:hypothetical protein FACS1894199_08890 [Bacteroidia bacterium]|nr:hypothetical protein FACS1894199_08890 [Bacteroidia bacterium]